MNPQGLATMFDAAALTAVGPLLALSAGVLLLLVASIFRLSHALRGPFVLLSLTGAAVLNLRMLACEQLPGRVLDGTLLCNHTTAMWGLIFVVCTAAAWLYSRSYYGEDRPFLNEHDVLLLLTPVGMTLMAGANDLIVFFIGLELLSIPLYALAAFRRNRTRSVEAGLKYFLLGAFAAAFFLYGAALLYTVTGSLSLDAFADPARRAAILAQPLALVGVALISASVFFKVSVFPFHLWVPDVYEGSPTPIAGLMATGTKAAAFAFLLNAMAFLPNSAASSIALIALLTMAAGNFGALVQTDAKRMLAYSGIAHAGTIVLAIAAFLAYRAAHPEAGEAELAATRADVTQACLFYLAAYAATAAGAFGVLSMLEPHDEQGAEQGRPSATSIEALKGLGSRQPVLASALTLFMLSLGGIPATGGFFGKYLVFSVAVSAQMTLFAVLGVLLSVVALAYYLRIVIAMWMQPTAEGHGDSNVPATRAATIASLVCAVLVVWMGMMPRMFLDAM
jgi:NADH-quinone oxidoreductase subunit N